MLWSHKDPALELLKYVQSLITDCICHYFATLLEFLPLDFVFSYACMYILRMLWFYVLTGKNHMQGDNIFLHFLSKTAVACVFRLLCCCGSTLLSTEIPK